MSAVDRAINDPGPFRNGYQREFASATGNGPVINSTIAGGSLLNR